MEFISDPDLTFLASWRDDITEKVTYMRPDRSSVSTL